MALSQVGNSGGCLAGAAFTRFQNPAHHSRCVATVKPEKSPNVLVGGVLPLEEFFFFLLANTLVAFGIVLVMADESHGRFVIV